MEFEMAAQSEAGWTKLTSRQSGMDGGRQNAHLGEQHKANDARKLTVGPRIRRLPADWAKVARQGIQDRRSRPDE
jgi:hypothetical protein